MSHQRYGDLALTEEIVKDREHFLVCFVILLKTWHSDNLLQFFFLVVAKVEKQVVTMISNHRRQESVHLLVSDLHLFVRHCIAEDAFPDVVIVLKQMSHQRAFITALIAVLVLNQRNEISRLQSYRHVALVCIPLTLVFGNPNVPVSLVVVEENLLKNKNQVVQVCYRLLILEFRLTFTVLHLWVLGFI